MRFKGRTSKEVGKRGHLLLSPSPGISCETLVRLQLLSAQSLVTGHKVSSVEEGEGWIKDYSKQERVTVYKPIPYQEMGVQCI